MDNRENKESGGCSRWLMFKNGDSFKFFRGQNLRETRNWILRIENNKALRATRSLERSKEGYSLLAKEGKEIGRFEDKCMEELLFQR